MKSTKLSVTLAAVTLAFAYGTNAFADDKWIGDVGSNWLEHVQATPSTKTRAEVRAELDQARKSGQLSTGEDPFYPRQPASIQTKTRAEVQSETVQAAKATRNGRDSIYFGG